jgi:hypothetical protein
MAQETTENTSRSRRTARATQPVSRRMFVRLLSKKKVFAKRKIALALSDREIFQTKTP